MVLKHVCFYTKYEEDLTQKRRQPHPEIQKLKVIYPKKEDDLTQKMISLALCLVISLDLYSLIPVVSSLH